MPAVRSRHATSSSMFKGDVEKEKRKRTQATFSDDEDSPRDDKASMSMSSSQFSMDTRERRGGSYGMDSDEVENDFEMFNKAVTGNHPVDHQELLAKMHGRFKKKALKWESMAKRYNGFAFVLNFMLLLFPVMQMMLCQAKAFLDVKTTTNTLKPTAARSRSVWQKIGISGNTNKTTSEEPLFPSFITVELLHCTLAVLAALIAGLQLKLKPKEKAEKYKKGAKAYGKLLRMSSYYSMITESGGKIDDVTGLWREAMIRENKEVPCIRSFTAI